MFRGAICGAAFVALVCLCAVVASEWQQERLAVVVAETTELARLQTNLARAADNGEAASNRGLTALAAYRNGESDDMAAVSKAGKLADTYYLEAVEIREKIDAQAKRLREARLAAGLE